jgi:hypothetical protein
MEVFGKAVAWWWRAWSVMSSVADGLGKGALARCKSASAGNNTVDWYGRLVRLRLAEGCWSMCMFAVVSPHSIARGEGEGEDEFGTPLKEMMVVSVVR